MNSSEVAASGSIASVNCASQIRIKREDEQLLIFLPAEQETSADLNWGELCQALTLRLQGSKATWSAGMKVQLVAKDRLLDGRQLQLLALTLNQLELQLESISTNRRQTAVAGATAGYSIQQQSGTSLLSSASTNAQKSLSEPLYLETTVRSGVEIRHPGTVIILGDLNPGGIIIAAGDIVIWGNLRGIAHAGAQGNRQARIMALRMEPTQLRIADLVARAPDGPNGQFEPEVAYITKQGIRITRAVNFMKAYAFVKEAQAWTAAGTNNSENLQLK